MFGLYLAVYFKSNIGKNCQADQIIDTEDTCKVAANVLGLSYVRVRPNSNSYCPAGCYWPSSNSDVAFFNLLTDPSETDPEHFGVKGKYPTSSYIALTLILPSGQEG